MFQNSIAVRYLLCVMFFLSGFCGLLYQTIWLRLAFSHFGVISPIISIVVSVFMLGLALGSWLAGKYVSFVKRQMGISAITIYGILECFIGVGAFVVPIFFSWGAVILMRLEGSASWSYLLASAVVITLSILPWAVAMGCTYPVVLEFLQEYPKKDPRSFGMLYTANTAGAVVGVLLTVFIFIELFGFMTTLKLTACCNFSIGLVALLWGFRKNLDVFSTKEDHYYFRAIALTHRRRILGMLFATGLSSMAMEVIWIRCFSTLLGSYVYSFALLLAFYLTSNWLGACLYRGDVARNKIQSQPSLITAAAVTACIPLMANDPQFLRWLLPSDSQSSFILSITALFSIAPFSLVLGYLTPSLVDNFSEGLPSEAGKAYALNILGCILGPILAGYLFLPLIGASHSLIVFVLPLLFFLLTNSGSEESRTITKIIAVFCGIVLASSFLTKSWEEGGRMYASKDYKVEQLHRDYTATTIAGYSEGMKFLKVNGVGMTSLSQDTKFMAHLPLAAHINYPKSILVVCFGMGTTFRSASMWDARVTVVELLPSVIGSFNYFHSDANSILTNPNNRVIIDDGRRFLKRTTEKFDVVIVDPPPPLETAASSLLYSTEFFAEVKKHLAPGGILMEWYGFPYSERASLQALTRSIALSFPHVRIYKALNEPRIAGYFFLCSEDPIQTLTPDEFISRLPLKAKKDLMEWMPAGNQLVRLKSQADAIILNEISPDQFLVANQATVITDDHPFNEYFFIRGYL